MSAGSEDFFAKLGFDASGIVAEARRANKALGTLATSTQALARATRLYNTAATKQIAIFRSVGGVLQVAAVAQRDLVVNQRASEKSTANLNKSVLRTQKIVESVRSAMDGYGNRLQTVNKRTVQFGSGSKNVVGVLKGLTAEGQQVTRTFTGLSNGLIKTKTVLGTLVSNAQAPIQNISAAARGQGLVFTELNNALGAYRAKLSDAKVVSKSFNSETGQGQLVLQGYTNTNKKATVTLKRLADGTIKAKTSLKNLRKETKTNKVAASELILTWREVLKIFAIQLARRAVSELATALKDSVQDAAELSIKIAEVQTISQGSNVSTRQWAAGLRELSDSFGLDILDQTEAAYQALSNQVVEGIETFNFLTEANKLAIGTVSSTADAVNVLSSTINAFGLKTSDADEISAGFFKTVELGRIRLSEISNTIGRVAVPASELGISFQELQAALAVTTIKGVPAAEAMTLLRNIFLKLIKPTTAMKDLFAELGVESGPAALKTFGLAKFLQLLEEKTKGSSTELGRLFGRIRAIISAMVFAGEGVGKFSNALLAIKNSTKSFNTAVETVLKSIGKRFEIELKRIKNVFVASFGREFLTRLLDAGQALGGLGNAIISLAQVASGFAVSFAVVGTALALSNPIGQSIIALGVLTAAFTTLIAKINESKLAERKRVEAFRRGQTDIAIAARKEAESRAAVIKEITKIQGRDVLQAVANVTKEILRQDKDAVDRIKILNKALDNSFETALKGIAKNIADLRTKLDGVRGDIHSIISNITNLQDKRTAFNFELNIRDQDPAAQLKAILERSRTFEIQGLRLFDKGNLDLGRSRFDEAIENTKRADSLQRDIQAKNKQTLLDRKKAEQDITKTVLEGQKRQKDLTKDIAKARLSGTEGVKQVLELERKRRNEQQLTKEKVKELIAKRKELKVIAFDEFDIRKRFNALIDEQIAAEARLAEKRKEQKLALEDEITKRKLIRSEVEALSKISGRSISVELNAKTLEQQRALFGEREDATKRLLDLGGKIGLTDEDRLRLTTRLETERGLLQRKNRKDELSTARKNLEDSVKNRNIQLDNLAKVEAAQLRLGASSDQQLRELLTRLGKFPKELSLRIRVPGPTGDVTRLIPSPIDPREFDQLKDKLQELSNIPVGERTKQNFIDIARIATRIDKILKSFDEVRLLNNATPLGLETEKLVETTGSLAASLSKTQNSFIEIFRAFQENQSKAIENASQLTALIQSQQNLSGVANSEAERQVNILNKFNEAQATMIQNLKKLQDLGNLRVVETIQNPLARAGGGLTTVGTDRIPALLSPGEFVVNARSTKKFINTLSTMNSGISRFASGGLVGGTTVGDINITAQGSGNTAMDVTAIGKQLKREIRRGRLTL